MTQRPTRNTSSILQGGKLKAGIYKIQNVFTETWVDIEVHSRGVCCRPAGNLEEGNDLVRPHPQFGVYVSDNHKWEIQHLGAGYFVKRVSVDADQHKSLLQYAERHGA